MVRNCPHDRRPSAPRFDTDTVRVVVPIILVLQLSAIMQPSQAYPLTDIHRSNNLYNQPYAVHTLSVARAGLSQHAERIAYAQEYLQHFGFLGEDEELRTQSVLTNAILRFQRSVSLPLTAQLDDVTFNEMKKPHCATAAIHARRLKRFATAPSSRWNKLTADNELHLKWFISHYTKDMPRAEIRSIVRKSFAMWSTQTKIASMPSVTLEFEEATRESDADITILWAKGDHGDAYKFDGTGNHTNILAHTFYPNYQETGTLNGDIHLDDSEKWTSDGSEEGTAFSNVFIHEIGHALGLGHSRRKDAIMFPIYKKDVLEHGSFDLDDKCALNWNYIGPTNFCLFVWLMSEVLPRQIENEESDEMANDLMSTMHTVELSLTSKVDGLKQRLREVAIPQCRDDNDVKRKFEELLQNKLNLPDETALSYSDVVCNFLNGLNKYTEEEEKGRDLRLNGNEIEDERSSGDESRLVQMAQQFFRQHSSILQHMPRRHRRRLAPAHRFRHQHTSPFDSNFFDRSFFNHFFTFLAQ